MLCIKMFLDVDHHVLFQYLGRGNYVPKQYHAPIRVILERARILEQHGKWLLVQVPNNGSFALTMYFIEQDIAQHFRARVQKTIMENQCWAVLPFYLQNGKSLIDQTVQLTFDVKAVRVKKQGLMTFAHLVLQVSGIRQIGHRTVRLN